MEKDLASLHLRATASEDTIISLKFQLKERQSLLTITRKRLYASQKQCQRAKSRLNHVQLQYNNIRIWNPTRNGIYTEDARELARALTFAGCAAEKVKFAVRSCTNVFGIRVLRDMSRWTVGHAIDEGGKYGEIQLGRKILESPGFIESSDGTTHRRITVESRHITVHSASYGPGVDDSDMSTWSHNTRFLEVQPALDHTAQRQFEGTREAAQRIADVYSRSPLAAKEQRVMTEDDYFRKKLGENKDHAADGKKAFKLSAEHKQDIVRKDLGRKKIDDMEVNELLEAMLSITDEEVHEANKLTAEEFDTLSEDERRSLVHSALEQKIGEEEFDSLPQQQQQNADTMVFGGCCCHKDLNVAKYGTVEMAGGWEEADLEPPVLLANKANHSIIKISADCDAAAVQNAIENSSRGAIKLLQLLGALVRHKDGERGYQDKYIVFMREQKLVIFDLDEPGKFPDVSNIRYQTYTYAAAEVIIYHGLFQSLIMEIIDMKTKSGFANHVEANILKGLNCAATLSELCALALTGGIASSPEFSSPQLAPSQPSDQNHMIPIK
ncbi:hypothetical protein C8J56DRAFT_798623 [Mycena floridula]|nr:hypothetical protein C8J56DRAFT_798623 [Mycena floridula]